MHMYIYIYIHIYKLLKVYLTHLEYDAPLQSRLQLYSTTDVRISHIIAFITPHSGYLRTVPNGAEVPIFSRTISNYFEPFVFVPSIPPNGSERFRGSLCNLGAPARKQEYWVIKIRLCQENEKYSSTANGRSHIESSSEQKVSYTKFPHSSVTFVHIQTNLRSGESEVRKLEVATWLHQSMTCPPWTERAGTSSGQRRQKPPAEPCQSCTRTIREPTEGASEPFGTVRNRSEVPSTRPR